MMKPIIIDDQGNIYPECDTSCRLESFLEHQYEGVSLFHKCLTDLLVRHRDNAPEVDPLIQVLIETSGRWQSQLAEALSIIIAPDGPDTIN